MKTIESKASLPNVLSMTPADKKNTKIVATVGPASRAYTTLLELVKAGVNIFRLNFSHGDHAVHLETIQNINYINEKYGLHIGILADLQGPKLRVGMIENNALELNPGDIVTFVNEECLGTKEKIYMSYKDFAKDVAVGERILLDDGKFVFEVVETNGKDLARMKVIYGGILSSKKGVNLPDTKTSLPCLTPKDLADLEFLLTQPSVNWIALSFVRKAEDIYDLRARLDKAKHPALVIAKIEKPEAIENLDSIIKASNGIMVARGDLGVEFAMERLPILQKEIVAKCIQRARPVIVATQMMESMIQNPSPTRAEITDVANAVIDGTDAVMLSAETAAGKYPVETVKAMTKIILEAEKLPVRFKRPELHRKSGTFCSDVVCLNAAKVAEELEAKAIIGFTSSGYTAFKVSSYRPHTSIHIFSGKPEMLATLNLVWGVKCYYYDKYSTTDETISDTIEILKINGRLKKGDLAVNVGSMPLQKKLRTNMLKVSVVD
jgi:pyruvate kinase